MSRAGHPERGDTLVEVVVSFAIFAVVAVSVSFLMNRGLAIGQQSLELALVREQISAQAEMLRFARYDANDDAWKAAIERVVVSVDASANPENCERPPEGSQAFVLHPDGGSLRIRAVSGDDNYVNPDASSFVGDDGEAHGMWIQAARAETNPGGKVAYDFYIHACWYMPSSERPQTLVTAVRLYGEG